MKVTMHHPDLKDSTREVDARAFEVVWKERGWKAGEYKKPVRKSSKKKTAEDSTVVSDT